MSESVHIEVRQNMECVESRSFSLGRFIVVGRDAENDLVLPSRSVSRRHARIHLQENGVTIEDLSQNGISTENGRIVSGATFPLDSAFEIGPYWIVFSRQSENPRMDAEKQRRELLDGLIREVDLRSVDRQDDALRPRVEAALERMIACSGPIESKEREALVKELADEAIGLGCLEPLLADESVSEIMVVDFRTIFAERKGRLEKTDLFFSSEKALRTVIERIIAPLGRRIDESSPMVDARLSDGSRVNAVIPPLALRGACLTIRKFPSKSLGIEDLVRFGSLTEPMAALLTQAVRRRANIVISGGTGSGKTTLLNVLSSAIPEGERIVTVEDAAELRLSQAHVIPMESRPPNAEGKGQVTIRDLVRNALRMRPDRIVIGECRGGEALDMLQAMNTGHDGSLTTTHANSPHEAISRLETLCLMGGLDLPLRAIREQIAKAIHLVVQQMRFSDGSRKITAISEIAGIDDDGQVRVREIFRFQAEEGQAKGGRFLASGWLPACLGAEASPFGISTGENDRC